MVVKHTAFKPPCLQSSLLPYVSCMELFDCIIRKSPGYRLTMKKVSFL